MAFSLGAIGGQLCSIYVDYGVKLFQIDVISYLCSPYV
jgi:hypothetical protein